MFTINCLATQTLLVTTHFVGCCAQIFTAVYGVEISSLKSCGIDDVRFVVVATANGLNSCVFGAVLLACETASARSHAWRGHGAGCATASESTDGRTESWSKSVLRKIPNGDREMESATSWSRSCRRNSWTPSPSSQERAGPRWRWLSGRS